MLQQISIIGNLAANAEEKTGREGNPFISFKVIVSDSMNKEIKTRYDVAYRKDGLMNYLKKGQQVYVSGRLSLSANLGSDGKAYVNASVMARDIELCGSPRQQQGQD